MSGRTDKESRRASLPVRLIPYAVSILFLIACLIFGDVYYETNDDSVLNLIAAGAYGEPVAPYMIFSNVCYGYLLNMLYSLIPGINWYFLIVIVLNALGAGIIADMLAGKTQSIAKALTVSFAVNLLLTEDFYLSLQFTKNAAFCFLVGCLLLYKAWRNGSISLIPCGTWYVLMGVMIRKEACLPVMPFMMLCVAFSLRKTKRVKLLAAALIPSVVLVSMVLIVHEAVYAAPEWAEYRETFAARYALYDGGGRAYYPEHGEDYARIGLSENDVELMKSYVIMDTDSITADVWQEVGRIISMEQESGYRISLPLIKSMAGAAAETLAEKTLPKVFVILALAGVLLLTKKERIFVLLTILSIAACYWYFACVNRFQWRVELICYLAGSICMAVFLSERAACGHDLSRVFRWTAAVLTVASIAGLVFIRTAHIRRIESRPAGTSDTAQRFEELYAREDVFYLGNDFSVSSPLSRITRTRYGGLYRRYCFLGGWTVPTPTGLYYARQYGIDNPVRSLVTRDDVRLLANEDLAERIRVHLEEVTGKTVTKEERASGCWSFGTEGQ